ncbi:MAG: GIY-YIG nuclease family protein [Patescibacteria group bacterium]
MYFVYILKSLKDGKTYVGCTHELKQRLGLHNAGRVISTRYRKPFKLLLSEEFKTAKEAKQRELWWKSGSGRRKLRGFFENA